MAYTPTTYVDGPGLVIQDTNGRYRRITVSTAGVLSTVDLGTTPPTGTPIVSATLNKAEAAIAEAHTLAEAQEVTVDNRGNLGATPTLNMAGKKRVALFGTVNANTVLTVSNLTAGQEIMLLCQHDATTTAYTFSVTVAGGSVLPASAVTIPSTASTYFTVEYLAQSTTVLQQKDVTATGTGLPPGTTPAVPPANITPPDISGTGVLGSTMTVFAGNWTGTPPITFAYQWTREGVDISGATSTTYTIVTADQGHNLQVRVSATNVATGVASPVVRLSDIFFVPTPGQINNAIILDGEYTTGGTGSTLGAGGIDAYNAIPDANGSLNEMEVFTGTGTKTATSLVVGVYESGGGGYASSVLADAPTMYLRLDEPTGGTFADSSGNNSPGTASGTVTNNVTSLLPAGTGKAVTFGTGTINRALGALNGSFSIEFWLRILSAPGAGVFTNLVARGNTIAYYNSSRAINLSRAGTAMLVTPPTIPLTTNTHVAFTYDQPTTTLRCFINGTESVPARNTGAVMTTDATSATAQLLGRDDTLDEVAIYLTRVPDARIAAHFTASSGTGIEPSNLLGQATITGGPFPDNTWMSATLPNLNVTGGATYWLSVAPLGGSFNIPATTGTGHNVRASADGVVTTTLPGTFPGSPTSSTLTTVGIRANGILADVGNPPDNGGNADVLWRADADVGSSMFDAMRLGWATGNAADVNGGLGTFTTDTRWANTTRWARNTASPTPLKGTYCWKAMTINGDVDTTTSSGARRTELGNSNSSRQFNDGTGDRLAREGTEHWYSWAMWIPTSYPNSASWLTFFQWKGSGSGNGPFGFSFVGGRVQWDRSSDQTAGSTTIPTIWRDPRTSGTTRNTWLKFVAGIRYSQGSGGWCELWGDIADGAGYHQLMTRSNRWTLEFASGGGIAPVGWRFGQYTNGATGTLQVFYDCLGVASTRAGAESLVL